MDGPTPELIADHFSGTDDLVGTVERLVADGRLAAGDRLPTVRALARRLGVSPTTVAGAWRTLRAHGTIETHGRAGSFVAGHDRPAARSWLSGQPGRYRLDLSAGTPDPDLLPDLSSFLARPGRAPAEAATYLGPVILPELEDRIRELLPHRPERVTVVDGTLDALDRLMAAHVRRASTVLIEDPCFPPVAELAEIHGGRLHPVAVDAGGPVLEALAAALDTRPSLLVLQPRANNPTGVSTAADRIGGMAAHLAAIPDMLVIEVDSCGDVATAPAVSLASHMPDRVVHVRSFSKSHGPDLRLAAVCGPAAVVEPLVERRRLGPIWSPRFLQQALAAMLGDPAVERSVDRARRLYADRRRALTSELDRLGVETVGDDGFNVWIPVHNERDAMVALAAGGIGVTPGSPFQLRPGSPPHVRVTVSRALDDPAAVAAALADAGRFTGRNGAFVV